MIEKVVYKDAAAQSKSALVNKGESNQDQHFKLKNYGSAATQSGSPC